MKPIDFSKLSDPERLALAKEFVSNISGSLPKSLFAGAYTLKSKIPFKVASFRDILIHRFQDLTDVAILQYEGNRLVPAFIITRAAVETAAILFFVFERLGVFLHKAEVDKLNEFLNKVLLGSKDESTSYVAHNILTAVDCVDKQYVGYRKMYNSLCEFTHPNWSGGMGSYSKMDFEKHTLHLGKELARPPLGMGLAPLVASLAIFQDYYNELADVIKQLNDAYEQGKF